MALIAATTDRAELVATVANALAHHGLEVPFDESAARLAAVVSGDAEGESTRWLRGQVSRLTAEFEAEDKRRR